MPPKKKSSTDSSAREGYRAKLDETARSDALRSFYNPTVGQHDEVKGGPRDKHGNRSGDIADLGRTGAFSGFKLLFGEFLGVLNLSLPEKALQQKGFQVKIVKTEDAFLKQLDWCDAAAIMSGSTPNKKKITGTKEYYPAWKDASQEKFVAGCTAARACGKGFWVWADNDPLFEQANAVLDEWFGFKLEGNTPGNKVLKLGQGREGELEAGEFRRHTVTSGIEKLYEGVTICHPPEKGDVTVEEMEVLAVSTDGWPCSLCRDNVSEQDENGRLLIDCGWTKLFSQWDDAGTARYVVNGFVWLLALEHKELRHTMGGSSGSSGSSFGAVAEAKGPSLAEQHELIDAAKNRDFEKVRQMIKKSPGLVNVQPSGRWSALHQAAEAGDAGAVKFLLDNGAALDVVTKEGKTPKDIADPKVAAMLVGKRAKEVPPLAQQHEFIDAAKNRDFEKVRQMVEQSPGIVNVQPGGRWSALHQAAEAGDAGAIKFLVEHGATLDVVTKDGKTPIEVADSKVAGLLACEPPQKKAKKG